MKMAKIGIYLDSLATARIHHHHANVFQLYIQELMTFAGIQELRFGGQNGRWRF
jgi:hypothetical protein